MERNEKARQPNGGTEMGETGEVIISILFFGGLFFFDSWAWGRVGRKLGYSFWAFALTLWALVFVIISILLLGLLIRVGHETVELIIGICYYVGFFVLCGWLWGKIAKKLGHSFWVHALTFWLAPVTLLYLGFSRERGPIPSSPGPDSVGFDSS
jgi:hypothetical protein